MRKPAIAISRPLRESNTNCSVPIAAWPKQPAVPNHEGVFERASDTIRLSLRNGYEVVFSPFSDANVVVFDPAAQIVLDTLAQPQTPAVDLGLVELSLDDVVNITSRLQDLPLLRSSDHGPVNPSRSHALAAWLHVTNACNLRCTYCYVDKTEQPMDEDTGRAAVEAIFRSAVRNRFRAVDLKYAGGEATLNFALVRRLHEHATNLAAAAGLGLEESVLSNGIALTRPMIEFMVANDMRLMISLDGIGAAHDAQRVFVNGRGSSIQVERAIDRAIALGLPPDLSITVTAANAGQLSEVVAFALDRNLRFNLNFYRQAKSSASVSELRAEDEQIIAGVKAAFAVIEERLPRYRLIDSLLDRSSFSRSHEFACGAGRSLLVIDQAGSVARCQMEIESPVTNIFAEDPLEVIQLHSGGFQSVSVTEKEGCKDCAWRFWCAGGCPLLTYRATGRTDVKSPYCNVYKALFPELLRLEGLRLLKWGSD